MPVIYVYAFERDLDKKREIVAKLTNVTCETYEVPPESVTVYLFDVPKENAAHGGVLVADSERTEPT